MAPKSVEEFEEYICEMARQKEMLELSRDYHSEIVSINIAENSKYNNAVMAIGYAGIFGIITVSRDILPDQLLVFCALFTGISLVCYITYEIASMLIRGLEIKLSADLLVDPSTPEEFEERKRKVQNIINRASLLHQKGWGLFFIASLVGGYVAAIALIVGLMCSLVS